MRNKYPKKITNQRNEKVIIFDLFLLSFFYFSRSYRRKYFWIISGSSYGLFFSPIYNA